MRHLLKIHPLEFASSDGGSYFLFQCANAKDATSWISVHRLGKKDTPIYSGCLLSDALASSSYSFNRNELLPIRIACRVNSQNREALNTNKS